ncbi:MAG: RagB/SusD family nutrient uptake outer membrane protein [Cyclobacteriaceae bacterium]|nr:RagB/SusD family nutrient uptake outer membrane protein [Cyclobacteriaceae bacterium]
MKKFSIILVVILIGFVTSCGDDFLKKEPLGVVGDAQLANNKGLDALLIAAYAQLDGLGHSNSGTWPGGASNFIWGSIASDNAYKGTDANDQPAMTDVERYVATPLTVYQDAEWRGLYDGVSRSNDVIKVAAVALEAGTITQADHDAYVAEARFLRGHYHFDAKQEFGNIPYIDETVEDYFTVGNVTEGGEYIDAWPKIEADFQHAIQNLPEIRSQKGRCDQWAAKAYLAKCYMWQMKLSDAKPLLDDLLGSSSPYELVDNYHHNFKITENNNSESIWEYQASVNDGSSGNNGNWADVLNFPYGGGPGTCCGFHQPSINGVNAHQTDGNGLPLLDTFNDTDLVNDQGINSADPFTEHAGPIDPRLDWSVGRRGIAYLDWGEHPGKEWIRDQAYGGPYAPKKNVYYQAEEGSLTDAAGWTSGANANNVRIIRLAHVILWRAEVAAAETDLTTARDLVNLLRLRADNYHVQGGGVEDDGTHPNDEANYDVRPYASFPDVDYAWKAIKFEHRLEFFMEGFRFFNLVRWGDAADVLNKYLEKEQTHRGYLVGVSFVAGKNERFPIPQKQIDVVGPEVLKQNPGYN